MFTLVTDRSKYFRVKRGQTEKETEAALRAPIKDFFYGAIVPLDREMDVYVVQPLESYKTISRKLNISEEELKKINFSKPVYPSCKLFVPCKK